MSDSILDHISNAAGGNPYNGTGIPLSGAGQSGSAGVSNINGGAVNLNRPMKLTHSLDGIMDRAIPLNFNESKK